MKIFEKILAMRLQIVIPSLIGLDQVGFVPNREAQNNILKDKFLDTICPENQDTTLPPLIRCVEGL